MKKILLFAACALLLNQTHAQYVHCATVQHQADLEQQYPWIATNRAQIEADMQKMIHKQQNQKTMTTLVTIPVVVHVLYNGAAQNIPDAQVIEQINVLNNDYARLNADTTNTPAPFAAVAANTQVQFCLASYDPNGIATTGIIHKPTTVGSFNTNDNAKHNATGGDDAWPRASYLNLWVCNLGGGLLGYAQFPGGPAATDGVVVLTGSVGGPNYPGSAAPYDLGRTATHEVGHWLNLYHIWGDDGGSCSGSDSVADTPNQSSENYGCPGYPHTDACSPNNPGVMFENYMDYTDDGCMNIFTQGQATRIQACVNTARASLFNSQGCQIITTFQLDAGVSAIVFPTGSLCTTSFDPIITLRNFGLTTLTSVTISYQVDAGTVNTYNWSGSLATTLATNITLPTQTVTQGSHTFTAYTSSPNAGLDGNAANDSHTGNFVAAPAGIPAPVMQNLDGATFPPTGYTINNPDGGITWAQTNVASQSGPSSMFMNDFSYSSSGEFDEFIMPATDLTTVANPVLTFYVAYQLFTDPTLSPNYSDTLQVWISTDCGVTYTPIYDKYSTALVTTTPVFSPNEFVPAAADWRLETVSLSSYAASNNAIVNFHHTTQFENDMFVDQINIINALAIDKINNEVSFAVTPIPSKGIFDLSIITRTPQNINLSVNDLQGRQIYQSEIATASTSKHKLDLSKLANGMYNLTLRTANGVAVKKLVINH